MSEKFTVVFAGNLTAIDGNPFKMDSPYGKPFAIGVGSAFDEADRLRAAMLEACDLLAERTHGSPARSAGHNARLCLEWALTTGNRQNG